MSTPDKVKAKSQRHLAWDWWRNLQAFETADGRKLPGERAALARLRRATSPFEAAGEPETIRLFKQLGFRDPDRLGRVAVLASVLAHVRQDSKDQVARALGPPRGGKPENAVYSALRLRRLLGTRGDDDLLIAFRRVVAMLGDTANVRDLTHQIQNWDHDEWGDRTRTLFAFHYHDAGEHAPGADADAAAAPSSPHEKA